MSSKRRFKRILSGANFENKSEKELANEIHSLLENGMHGICYSAYEEGQKPGDILSEEQIRRRMKILQPFTNWIRSFSCVEGNELIPKVAKEMGLKTMVGAWLGSDIDMNEDEIEGLISMAKQGHVDIAAVGNEVLYRNDLPKEDLLKYIDRVKKAVPHVQVGYVDAYYEFTQHPDLVNACDVVLANCYPFWEECHIDYSLLYMKQMYQQALDAAQGKKVIITETGWPSAGTSLGEAEPSMRNAMIYLINALEWSAMEDIDMFYFTSFDESWKVGAEGDVGAYWGIWDKDNELKY